MRRYIERARRRLRFVPRVLASMLGAAVLVACLFALTPTLVVSAAKADPQNPNMRLLAAHTEAPAAIGPDYLMAEVDARITFTAAVAVDGEVHMAEMYDGDKVADLLEELDVELGPEDYVLPTTDKELDPAQGSPIVYRVSYQEEVRREQLDEDTLQRYLKKLSSEEAGAFVRGYNNMYDITYRDRLINDDVRYSEILALEPVPTPQGNRAALHNDFSDIEIGPNGAPTSYSWVMSGARTTAYSSSGGRGASGLGLYHGTVAVNPNVIPYGTRMYITAADGSYVYGFAIATDTGIALMDGRIDIDLYFGSNAECLAFGKRGMEVYILD